jgi:hypothetical protein
VIKLLLLFSLFNQSSFANFADAKKGKITLQSIDTPLEYRITVNSYNSYDLTSEEKDEYLKDIVTSDTYFSHIPKSELFLLCKTEIYKLVLSFPSKDGTPKRVINQNILNSLKQRAKAENLNQLAKWILNATISDVKKVINYKYYQTYLIQKSQKKKLSTIELLKIDKKVKLLSPWINIYLQNDPEQINMIVGPLHRKIIHRLAFLSKIIYKASSFEEAPKLSSIKNLKYFKYSRELTKSEDDLRKIDDIIGNISLFPKPSSNYQSPNSLPEPKNDWVPKDDMSKVTKPDVNLFPEYDPNYIRPEELPEPVNDWLLDN